MGRIIAFVSGKGGVGKSTVAAGVAIAASRTGKKVLLIDCDASADSQKIIFETGKETLFNLGDLIAERCDLLSVITKVKGQNIDIIAPPTSFNDLKLDAFFKNLVIKLSDIYDYILIDAPAGIGRGYELSLVAAHNAIIITNTSKSSISFASKISTDLSERNIKKHFLINKLKPKRERRLPVDVDEYIDGISAPLIGIFPKVSEEKIFNAKSMLSDHDTMMMFYGLLRRIDGGYVKLEISKKY